MNELPARGLHGNDQSSALRIDFLSKSNQREGKEAACPPEPNSNPGQINSFVPSVPANSQGDNRSNPLSQPQEVTAGWEREHACTQVLNLRSTLGPSLVGSDRDCLTPVHL